MAQFDLIVAAGKAYQTSWQERKYLFRLALVPFLVKAFCYLLSFSLGYEENLLMMTLLLLPAYFTEGWMLAHYVRLLVLGHRWPFRPTGNLQADLPILKSRARGVMGGLLVYVLISMALGGITAFMAHFTGALPDPAQDPSSVRPEIMIGMIGLMIFMVWAFRFLWLYIPYSLNLNADTYLHAVKGYASSLPLIGVWLVCIMPFFMAMQLFNKMAHSMGDNVASFVFVLLILVFDTIRSLVATAGITYGLQEVFQKNNKVDLRS